MVSVIITAYNYEKYIERAIESCLDQSINKDQYEIIVVNDCSIDNTVKILEKYSDDIKCFNLKKNVGLAASRNFGVKMAKGQFVVFLDADDYLHHDILLLQNNFLLENKIADAVSVDYFLVDEQGNHLRKINALEKPIACGVMFRKESLIDIGLYDESFRA